MWCCYTRRHCTARPGSPVVEAEHVVEDKPGGARRHQVEHLRKLQGPRLTLRLGTTRRKQ